MRRGVDYSWEPPTPSEIRAAGADFAVRYVGLPGHVKNLTRAEALALDAEGIDLVAVCQISDGFLFESGRDGRVDAVAAWLDASNCGMPAGRPIYFALDVDPAWLTFSQWQRVQRWFEGAASVLGRDRCRIYGGLMALDRACAQGWASAPGWQTRSWSTVDGQLTWSRFAGLRQVQHEVSLGSGVVDWNEAHVGDFGQWKAAKRLAPTRYPGALWRPLTGEEEREPITRMTQVIFHTMVGFLQATEDNFDRESNPLESHLGLGGPWDEGHGGHDGEMRQWMPFNRSADANGAANRRPDGTGAISVETSDGGDAMRPWSPKQLAWLVRFGNWAADNLGIPRRICRTPNDPGFGWHRLFDLWNPNRHSCPAATRIDQLRTIVLPAIFAGRNLDEEDFNMTPAEVQAGFAAALNDQKDELAKAVAEAIAPKIPTGIVTVRAEGDPRGVFAVTPMGLIHLDDPTHWSRIMGGKSITDTSLVVSSDWITAHLAGENV